MKFLALAAFIAAVASSPLSQSKNWPWQIGKEYTYNVDTHTLTRYDHSDSNGNALKAQFIIRAVARGQLIAKLIKPMYAQIQAGKMTDEPFLVLPSNLEYQPIQITDEPFEIYIDGGRVESFKVPFSLTVAHENLLKALISALQVDLSPYGHVDNFPNSYDKETFQGLFTKVETDVTGACETLYIVSPVSTEWRQEVPEFASEEDPVEVIKSKNYGSCKQRVANYFGVPDGGVWNGIAYNNVEKQFIKHKSEMRLLVGKQGTILKSEIISSVFASPLLIGKQKGEVYCYVKLYLSSVQEGNGAEWTKIEPRRHVPSLLFSMSESMFLPKAGDQDIDKVQKLLQDMTPLLQNPNKLPKADFLSKFIVLIRMIAPLNFEHLTRLTNSVEIAKSSKYAAKTGMWIIYRDAVAQAGSTAAFEQIKAWILTTKVRGEEAAELISSIGASFRNPTKKIMKEFFDLATNPKVMEEKFLNNSAFLAATKLMRFGHDDGLIVETVIPRLSKELKHAIENGDSKAEVYIRVLGNLAHPEILKVFAPYLNGSVPVTKYLRTQIVASLKVLANLKNEQVRSVLFSILRNTGETYEVRVAAALNIFMAFPTAEMMQVMAHMANVDRNTHIRAVLTSSIVSAANLKDPRFSELAKTAQSVKDILPKEELENYYSNNNMVDAYTSDDEIAYFNEFSFIGNRDVLLPIYQRLALRDRGTGLSEENQVTSSISSLQQLLEYVVQMNYEPNKYEIDLKYSAKKVAEELNITRRLGEPLEGGVFLEYLNQQKLITYNEDDFKSFIASSDNNMEQLFQGVDFQYTKILNGKQVSVMFPLATGMPFVYEYNEPLIYSAHGQVKIQLEKTKELTGSLHKELDFTYARNMDGSIGFLDTLSNVYAKAGVINKLQIYLPMTLNVVVQPKEIKLKFALPEKDANIIHFSVWPYIALQNIDSLLTVSENPKTKFIERSAKVVSTDMKFGHLVGVSLMFKGYSYSNDFKESKLYDDGKLLAIIDSLMYQKDIALTEFNLKYLAKETKNKELTFTAFYDTLYNQNYNGSMGPASILKDVAANSKARREELVKRAATEIGSATVQLCDLSMVFDGEHKVEYVLTAALANSLTHDHTIQGVFFFNGYEQINVVLKSVPLSNTTLNLEDAMKSKDKLIFDVDLKYGNFENVHLQGFGSRSDLATILSDPLTKQCLQVTKHNLFQKDCYKMTIKASTPDYFLVLVSYKELNPGILDLTQNICQFLLDTLFMEQQQFRLKKIYNDTISIEGQVDYALISDLFPGYENLPYCAVGHSNVCTFSGRSYIYNLTSSWHVVMLDEFYEFGQGTDLIILTRRSSDKLEVYISFKTEDRIYMEIEIKNNSVVVQSNAVKVSKGFVVSYWNEVEAPLLQYYNSDGTLHLDIQNKALHLVYDSQKLVIFTDVHHGTTTGLCGQSTTDTRDDYITPYGVVDRPDYYGASYSLDGEFSDPITEVLKKEARLKAYEPVIKYTNILQSDAEWSRA